MCLLTIATGASRRFPIVILNNRDEYVTRSTSKLTLFGPNGAPLAPSSSPTSPSASPTNANAGGESFPLSTTPTSSSRLANLLCAIDTSIPNGGTWMGVNILTGAFASVTNSPQCASQILDLPSLAPERIELSAASSSFDWRGYVAKVLDLHRHKASHSHSEGGAASASTSNFARPFLKFAPERSRGFIVGEYLSNSHWVSSSCPGEGENSAREERSGSLCWQPALPSNVALPSSVGGSNPSPSSTSSSSRRFHDSDLFYDGYNLLCGNLIEIANGLKRRRLGTCDSMKRDEGGVKGEGTLPCFLYTTNRQHPFPRSRRDRVGDDKRAPAFSKTWSLHAAKSPEAARDDGGIALAHQPSIYLGTDNNGGDDDGRCCEGQLCVNTVANTFLDNPIEPKSAFLTASVRRVLESIFPPSPPTTDNCRSTRAHEEKDVPSEATPPDASEDTFVKSILVPALAECLCAQPQLEVDLSEPNGKHAGLLAIKPMAGLNDAEYAAFLKDRITQRLKVENAGSQQEQEGNQQDSSDDDVIECLVEDIMSSRAAMVSAVAEEEHEVHRNVYTHLCRGAVNAGTFKTRTQTIAVLEDLDAAARDDQNRKSRYRLHYYLRDTYGVDSHGPWQVRVVDLPDPSERKG